MSDLPNPVADPSGQGEWVPHKDNTGRMYWINHTLRKTSWELPQPAAQPSYLHTTNPQGQPSYHDTRLPQHHQQQQSAVASYATRPAQVAPPEEQLPAGWESRFDSTGRKYYVDHNSKKTHWSIPPYLLSGSASSHQAGAPAHSTMQRASSYNQQRPQASGSMAHSASFRQQPSYMRDSGAPASPAAAGAPPSAPPSTPPARTSQRRPSMEEFRRMYSNSQFQGNADGGQQRAIQYAECVVCFDDMHKEPAGVFTLRGERTCPHFLHYRCAVEIQESSRGGAHCPVCRRKFDSVLQIPNIQDNPAAWFKAVDLSGDNSLNEREVLEVLKAQFAIDYDRLEQELPGLFARWDRTGSGTISQEEMMHPETGLLRHIRTNFLKEHREEIPDIRDDKDGWFDHFDYDRSQSLEQAEIVRALIKTFKLSEDKDKLEQMRGVVRAVWGVFDTDGNGTIDKSEFVSADGLADAIIASMAHMRL